MPGDAWALRFRDGTVGETRHVENHHPRATGLLPTASSLTSQGKRVGRESAPKRCRTLHMCQGGRRRAPAHRRPGEGRLTPPGSEGRAMFRGPPRRSDRSAVRTGRTAPRAARRRGTRSASRPRRRRGSRSHEGSSPAARSRGEGRPEPPRAGIPQAPGTPPGAPHRAIGRRALRPRRTRANVRAARSLRKTALHGA